MKKNILIELNRIKTLMNLINEQGSADINIDRLNKSQLSQAKDGFGPMTQYTNIEIGGAEYPVILPGYKTQVMGNPKPILKQSGSGVKASDFIPNVKIDEKGNEYIEKNGKKYCLPSKEFWNAFNSKNYVYQITNPRNNKKFSMKMSTKDSVEVPVLDEKGNLVRQKMKGSEASIKCIGGDNGWGFEFGDGNVLFWSEEGRSYNLSNPEHFDLRSDFDIWWDKWGLFVEIGVGILAALTGAGLAAELIAAGAFASTGLSTAYALGSSVTWLSVILQAGIEAALMAPIAVYQWERGQESNAILSMAFSFLPFLTELGSVQKFIRGGIQREVSASLQSKFLKVGGTSGLKNLESYKTFLNDLTASELMLWKATIEQFSTKEGQKMFTEGVKKYLKENELKITNEILGNKSWVNQMDDLTAGQFSKGAKMLLKQNPLKGTGVLANFIRMGIPIAGIVISFTSVYNKLRSLNFNNVQIEKIMTETKKSLDNSDFFVRLAKLDEERFKKLQEELLLKYFSKRQNGETILDDKIISKQLSSDLEKRAVEMVEENPETYKPFYSFVMSEETINNTFKTELMTYLENIGHENVEIVDESPFKTYKFSSSITPNGLITIVDPTNFKTSRDARNFDYEKGIQIST